MTPRSLFVCLMLLSFSPAALTLPEDREKPVQINAQRMEWNNQQQLATYTGQVEVVQGELVLKSEQLQIQRGEQGELTRAKAQSPGQRAYMRDLPDSNEPPVEAWAETIDYRPAAEQVILTGNAHLAQGQDSFRGHRLVYNLTTRDIRAEQATSDAPRVEVILTPRRKEPSQ